MEWDLAHGKEIFQYDTQRNGKLMLSQPEAIMITVSTGISEDFVLTTGRIGMTETEKLAENNHNSPVTSAQYIFLFGGKRSL